ncbi:hypothetical protein C9374_008032 [Naegleria lovaniensis]|uniref:Peptidase C1A papain C-terminal domain-containing protein n=1 Tax=Naegleria lovaniensis TaxID=51637 RepID=A0AA88KLG5_NAELO|nr:uncharacterized protein C9374_008032 [Naegleria lovaniensis]KAG2378884.1 hypothetical protein C9374_008032 [Naegleria lovaniensis]
MAALKTSILQLTLLACILALCFLSLSATTIYGRTQKKSTKPATPGGNRNSTRPSPHGGHRNSTKPAKPTKSKPTKPTKPTKPVKPTKPEKPVNGTTPANDDDLIERINSNHTIGWKATKYDRFENVTIGYLRDSLFGLSLLPNDPDTPTIEGEVRVQLPASFDARTAWPRCVLPIRDQQSCGACWAFSSAYVLAQRLCVATGAKSYVTLSPEYQVDCDTLQRGCQGGYLSSTWKFLTNTGTVPDACVPYVSGRRTSAGASQACPSQCKDGSALRFYKAKSASYIRGVDQIKIAIMTYGSVQVGFTVYRDFMSYKSGVYKHVSTTALGGHAVALIGWGTENGTPYWIGANSWSANWGERGYFRIALGSNESGIESQVYAGIPVV